MAHAFFYRRIQRAVLSGTRFGKQRSEIGGGIIWHCSQMMRRQIWQLLTQRHPRL